MHTRHATLPRSLQALAAIHGRIITSNDADYDDARRVFYGDVDKRPLAIVRAADTFDVQRVVTVARERGLELAVRSGGHSPAGHGTTDGGILLDVRSLSAIDVDVRAGTVAVGAGATALEVARALDEHRAVVGFGDAGSVGVAGITLGGGVGYMVRKLGLTIDVLLAAEVVTADGELRHVDADHEKELFWAIRGGGGNFGVATKFVFRLHDLPRFTGGILVLPASAETIAGFARAVFEAPEELSSIANVMPAPPMPFLPKEVHGRLAIVGMMAYAGDDVAASRALAPFRALATPLGDTVRPMKYAEMYPPEDPSFHPRVVVRTVFVDGIDLATAATMLSALTSSGGPMRVVQLRALGGAASRVSPDATAYAHRAKPMIVNVAAFYQTADEREAITRWAEDVARRVQPDQEAAYVNFLGDEGEARVRAAYPDATWERLRRIKALYDPTNLFRLNQNIPPASMAG
jgi:FAD/FMN-containing dehydrogenase